MVRTSVITHRLGLALRLLDTTSGQGISSRSVQLYGNGTLLKFSEKSGEILVFQDFGSEPLQLEIRSLVYEPLTITVEADKLAPASPLLELHLMPNARAARSPALLSLEGTLPGLRDVCAVRCGDAPCLIREVDAKRRLLKLYNPHHLELSRVHYGLVNPNKALFEPFRIQHLVNFQTIQVEKVPDMEIQNHFPVTPIIFGSAGAGGQYCLRVRDDGRTAQWLVRYTVEDAVRFATVDLRQEGQVILT